MMLSRHVPPTRLEFQHHEHVLPILLQPDPKPQAAEPRTDDSSLKWSLTWPLPGAPAIPVGGGSG